MDERTRAVSRRVVIGVTLLALVAPAVRDRDSFPLSKYPMYAFVRDDESAFARVIGWSADGDEVRLSMDVVAATDDPLIAAQRVRDAVARGEAARACTEVLGRAPDSVVEVAIVTEVHDIVAAARGEASLLDRAEHARCRR